MKSFRNLSAISLTLLMLLTVAGHVMSLHYCGGKFQKISFAGIAGTCQHEDLVPPCHRQHQQNNHSANHQGCCENQTIIKDQVDLQNPVFNKVNFQKTFVYVTIALPAYLGDQLVSQVEFVEKPFLIPRIERDRQVLFQSFLI